MKTISDVIAVFNPRAKGYYTDQCGRIAVKAQGVFVWFDLRQWQGDYRWLECGSTLTREGAKFVRHARA